ncbi:hypothetical protein E0L36_01645 [Streptomyces sp. AJS327]|uniref:hypothetical protein n=1 Tax=Streptomyces sp. AJS327 TaxID=2545265 RepID=UPI0015E05ED4|nr:hypothetical protein [Streptomyces sp. AJS327]MBA0049654.1 hypothetical protein [Streptomyces sp. AJS327]
MSLISALARVEAVAEGRAQPLTTVRHRHIAEHPLVLVPLATAGDPGAPLGALLGTDRAAPVLLTVAQPRNLDLRFAFLAELAEALLPHLESTLDEVEYEERTAPDPETGKRTTVQVELCVDAPQLLVPNTPGADFVRLLGRSTRFRRTAEDDPLNPYPAPARVPLLGRWLTHYGERARVPGSSLLLPMTQLLSRHWATGQSPLEDQHLGALLAWIDPPPRDPATPDGPRENGERAAFRAELGRDAAGQLLRPPAGPTTDPAFDNALLAPAIRRFDAGLPGAAEEVRELIAGQLLPTWEAMWRAVDLLRGLPEAGRVAERWKRDRWSYTGHRDRLRAGEPPQPRQDDAVTAARKLASREQAQAQLAAQEALDDPLVMAGRRLAGEAFQGEVVEVEMAFSGGPEERDAVSGAGAPASGGRGKRARPRPLVTLRTEDAPQMTEGERAHRALPGGGTQSARLVAGSGGPLLTLQLVNGMGRGKEPAPGSVPEPGDRLCWTLFEHAPRGGPGLPEPEDTPWTHGGPPEPASTAPDPVTSEDQL